MAASEQAAQEVAPRATAGPLAVPQGPRGPQIGALSHLDFVTGSTFLGHFRQTIRSWYRPKMG
jgi:hypothetical protein